MSEQRRDQVREHVFDGIQEFDNKLPNWWLLTLYGAIVFSVAYWLVFHTFHLVPLPEGRYALEMQRAAEEQLARASKAGVTDESLTLLASMPDKVAQGRKLFETYCVVCHGQQGEGLVGPNLTDEYWIHGGRPTDIYHTAMNGVLAKGMPAWGGQLGPTRVQLAVAYVLSIRNTNVPGKAPEGEKYDPAAAQAAAADTSGTGEAVPANAPAPEASGHE